MLWVCLCFPHLALDALAIETASSSRDETPRAVIDGPLQRRHIVFANAQAHRAGVRGGQALTAAHMLCPRLRVMPRDAAAEQQALESLAAIAYRYSAEIHIAEPEAIFIEVGASLSLFGGWPVLQRRLRGDLATAQFKYTLAAAPTATAARALAIHADGIAIPTSGLLENALGDVPISAVGFDTKINAALHGMGFRNLRDLFRLPRAELTRRIGEEALVHLDRMRGLVAEAWPRWLPPVRFRRRIEFSFGVESQAALAFPLQRLIREFALFLTARDGGVQRFALILGHERGASTRVDIGLLAPQRDGMNLFEFARARLERIELPAPVHALTLCADDLPSLCPLHQDLFDERHREQLDWPSLVERLRARLGDEALQGLAEIADHRPGRAWRFVPVLDRSNSTREKCPAAARGSFTKQAAAPSEPRAATSTTKSRPFWLLRQPILLRGVPTRILAGPERIESGWWDGHDYRRDYYIVETRLGQRAWAYVEAGAMSNWTLHGWFA